jgi:thymidylate synthase
MLVYKADNFAQLYKESLTDLVKNPQYCTSPRGFEIKENTNVCLILENPLNCLFKSPVRSSQKKYISAELLWYFIGNNDISFISKFSSFWEKIAINGRANSAYGHLLFTVENEYELRQYQWAVSSLYKDKESRQAIIHFNMPQHQHEGNTDFPCTLYGIFHIRDNKLNFTVHMRSNDVVWGLANDIAFFTVLQCQMLNHLKVKYTDLELGTYTHIADSYHLYSHHYEIIEKLIASDLTSDSIPMLQSNLVHTQGTPTKDFVELYSSYSNDTYITNDQFFNWIKTNLTKK